jgi:hypothetical protein
MKKQISRSTPVVVVVLSFNSNYICQGENSEYIKHYILTLSSFTSFLSSIKIRKFKKKPRTTKLFNAAVPNLSFFTYPFDENNKNVTPSIVKCVVCS